MKKYAYLLGLALLFAGLSSKAAPGDTTWVQTRLDTFGGYGSYDNAVTFPAPGTSYRKIYMIFTLGKYVCPGSPTYCGDWDYTVQNYLMTPSGDTLELGRLITPYANAAAPRTPWTWQQHYVFDVTDYVAMLHDTATMRIFYSGYTGGFTGSIAFAFIEGTPERNVVGVTRLWNGSFGYSGINAHFPTLPEVAPAGTQDATLKFTVTGHGGDQSSCCEFTAHDYHVFVDSTSIATKTIWRDDCGMNELYPQSGTWLYQRGNWCPGAQVYPNFHHLPGITGGTAFTTDIQFDPYTGSGSYTTEAHLIYYGAMNKAVDAAIEQIITPTIDENHFRENPTAGDPVIHIKNTGAAHIDSIYFEYGIADSPMQHYMWAGSLDSLQESDVTLPGYYYQLNNVSGTGDTFNYSVKILTVNGAPDADNTNNQMTSRFAAAPLWPDSVKIWFKTNNESLVSSPSISETSWTIYDMHGAVFAQRTNCALTTSYMDTIAFPPGYYHLVVTDSGCDGLQWWGFSSSGISSGLLMVRKMNNYNIPMKGYQYGGTYNNDFGCGFSQWFSTGGLVQTAISNVTQDEKSILAFPNPARDLVSVEFSGMQQVRGTMQLVDALGRTVASQRCSSLHTAFNTSSLPTGVYTIVFFDELQQNMKLTTRLVITK